MINNSLSRHRITDEWDVKYDGKLYHVTRSRSGSYPENWDVVSIINGPNGGQYNKYLFDNSKLKRKIVKWVQVELQWKESPHALDKI